MFTVKRFGLSFFLSFGAIAFGLLVISFGSGRTLANSDFRVPAAPTPGVTITSTVFLPVIITPFVIQDDFSDSASGWEVADLGIFGTSYTDGEYRIVMASGNAVGWGTANHELEDFEVAVDARLIDSGLYFNATGYAALVVMDGLGGCHELAIRSDGNWYFYYLDGCGLYIGSQYGSGRYTLLQSGKIPAFAGIKTATRLKMTRLNGEVFLYLGNTLVYSAPLSYSGEGKVLLKAQPINGGSYGVDARFDNYYLAER